jgi:uncharacterized membrane protein YjgN (DUF898 family)
VNENDREGPLAVLTYDGKIGELYRIFLVNLLLTVVTVVTVGIWRFWAITRMRRYLWSRTASGGERFEYDGTGGQLFVGFLLAIGLIIGMSIAAVLLSALLRMVHPLLSILPIVILYVSILVLALGAPFAAQRYRLGHTVWRGIRGGMQGSMIAYGLRSLLYSILTGLTLLQLLPWTSLRLLERRLNASSFGSLRFVFQGLARSLYPRFLVTWVAIVILAVVIFGPLFSFERPLMTVLSTNPLPPEAQVMLRHASCLFVGAYLIFLFASALVATGYLAAYLRHVAGRARLGDLCFACDATGRDMFMLLLGNVLILLVTLGLGQPVVIHRTARFVSTHLLTTGTLDLATLKQSEQPVSRFGEGMFQALDGGAGFI